VKTAIRGTFSGLIKSIYTGLDPALDYTGDRWRARAIADGYSRREVRGIADHRRRWGGVVTEKKAMDNMDRMLSWAMPSRSALLK